MEKHLFEINFPSEIPLGVGKQEYICGLYENSGHSTCQARL